MLVEAAGVEPDPGQFTNVLMAHDFRRKTLIPRRFPPSIESPAVPWSRPQDLPAGSGPTPQLLKSRVPAKRTKIWILLDIAPVHEAGIDRPL